MHPSKLFSSSSTQLGAATTVNSLVLHIVPNLQNAAGLAAYAQQASDPSSANYRHFLTPTDIAARFGATANDYAAVEAYFASYGLKVGGWPQRLAITVAGPRTTFEKALGTTFSYYRQSDGSKVIAPTGTIQFSKAIPISSIANAVIKPRAQWRNFVKPSLSQGTLSGATPQQIATAFDFTSAYSAGFTGKNITIGIIGTGPAMPVDFTTFKSQYNWGGASSLVFPPVTAAAAANAGGSPTGTPPPVTAPCTTSDSPYAPPSESPTSTCNPEDIEAQIDTEQATLAKDATVAFYLAYVPNECYDPTGTPCAPDPNTGEGYDYQGLDESDDEIQQIIADNTSDIVSGSYGGPELLQYPGYLTDDTGTTYNPNGLGPSELAALAAEGIATFMASGDQGAQTCAPYAGLNPSDQCVSYPGSDTSVTAVGGVTLPLTNAGTLAGPITGWGNQTNSSGFGGASGGGVSCLVPLPAWQTQASYETTPLLTNAGNTGCVDAGTPAGGGRLLPDVSLEGDPATSVAVVANVAFGEEQGEYGGTSVATPEMAAMWALVLQACAQTTTCATATGAKSYRLGNAAPFFWKNIYQKSQTAYNSTLLDITFGNNAILPCVYTSCPDPQPTIDPTIGFSALSGWDAITGLGVPFARHLITAVVGI
jgi:kumamolisin